MIHLVHKWKAIAAVQRKQPISAEIQLQIPEGAAVYMPKTDVLYRCTECGKLKSDDLSGTWTLEQINS